jgi:uncharacterized protein
VCSALDWLCRLTYVRDFLTGLKTCRAECAFFEFCRDAQTANRPTTTGTNYCQVSRQALVTALSTIATKEKEPAA